MTGLSIRHRNGEYPIHIGKGLLQQSELFASLPASPLLIVTDENVAGYWLESLRAQLPDAAVLTLPAGEQHKQLLTVNRVWDRLAALHASRDVMLIALGGGVIGDMTGFAAACWMRGVRYVQIPTTLLAQVDASVGGKTAVDHPAGKNLIGAFHQPQAVIIDIATLDTLPEREYRAGLAEVVKTALIADADFFDWLEQNAVALAGRSAQAITHAIESCCEIKAAIVAADETEHGQRALLNLGHTFGHAIEAVTGFNAILHGEAVATGLLLAADLSERTSGLDPALRPRLHRLLSEFGLPTALPAGVAPHELLEAMRLDKKHLKNQWRFVMLEAPGRAVLREVNDRQLVLDVLQQATRNRP